MNNSNNGYNGSNFRGPNAINGQHNGIRHNGNYRQHDRRDNSTAPRSYGNYNNNNNQLATALRELKKDKTIKLSLNKPGQLTEWEFQLNQTIFLKEPASAEIIIDIYEGIILRPGGAKTHVKQPTKFDSKKHAHGLAAPSTPSKTYSQTTTSGTTGTTTPTPTRTDDDIWDELNAIALGYIKSTISLDLKHIASDNTLTAHELIKALRDTCRQQMNGDIDDLETRYRNYSKRNPHNQVIEPLETYLRIKTDYFTEFDNANVALGNQPLPDAAKIKWLVRGLDSSLWGPHQYTLSTETNFLTLLTKIRTINKFRLQQNKDTKLIYHDTHQQLSDNQRPRSTQRNDSSRTYFQHQQQQHQQPSQALLGRRNGPPPSNRNFNPNCTHCGKPGHIANTCTDSCTRPTCYRKHCSHYDPSTDRTATSTPSSTTTTTTGHVKFATEQATPATTTTNHNGNDGNSNNYNQRTWGRHYLSPSTILTAIKNKTTFSEPQARAAIDNGSTFTGLPHLDYFVHGTLDNNKTTTTEGIDGSPLQSAATGFAVYKLYNHHTKSYVLVGQPDTPYQPKYAIPVISHGKFKRLPNFDIQQPTKAEDSRQPLRIYHNGSLWNTIYPDSDELYYCDIGPASPSE